MKIPHTFGKLARKRSILEAIIFEINANFSRFYKILGMKKSNVDAAIARLHNASMTASAQFIIPQRKKQGGIFDTVKVVARIGVTTWWMEESRVSPNRKDIRRKRLGRNVYDMCPTHLLIETQILLRMLPYFVV